MRQLDLDIGRAARALAIGVSRLGQMLAEVEDALITHLKVADGAVFGTPNEDFGAEGNTVMQSVDSVGAGPHLAGELLDLCHARLSKVKCPRSIDFDRESPRSPTGKFYKRLVRDRYRPSKWPSAHDSTGGLHNAPNLMPVFGIQGAAAPVGWLVDVSRYDRISHKGGIAAPRKRVDDEGS